jgi:hypothetical protein
MTNSESAGARGPWLRGAWAETLGWRDSFLGSLSPSLSRAAGLVALGLSLCSLAVFVGLAPDALSFGDGPIYSDRIARMAAFEQPYHMGYNLVAIAFTRLVPLGVDRALNIMSAFFGALCVGLAFTITYTLIGRISAGMAAAAVLASMYLFVENSTQAELYIVQLFFFLMCVQLVLWDKRILSGLAFACACLVTPSTVLAAPFLLLLRPQVRFVLAWLVTAAVVLLVSIAPLAQGYLFGPGSLSLMATPDLNLGDALAKEASQLGELSLALVFAVVGVFALGRRKRYWILLAGAGCLWLFPFLLGERYSDVPVQMPFYAIVAILAGVGFAWLLSAWHNRRVAAVSVVLALVATIATSAYSSYGRIRELNTASESYKQAILSKAASAPPGELAIGAYWATVLVDHYLAGRTNPQTITTDDLNGANGIDVQLEATTRLDNAIADRKRIWLLESSLTAKAAFFASNGYSIAPSGTSAHLWFALPTGGR